MRNKKLAFSGAIATFVAIMWGGASIYAGHRVEAELQAFQMAPRDARGGVRLSYLKHERELFSSKGRFEMSVTGDCDDSEDEGVRLLVSYKVSHLLLPTSPVRFDWQAVPIGEGANDFEEVFGPVQIRGHGGITLAGALRTAVVVPELSGKQAGSALQIAPSSGFLTIDDKRLGFGWTLPRILARGNGQAIEVKDLAIDVDLANRHLGTGVVSLSVAQVGAKFGTLEGLSVKSEAVEDGDQLRMSIRPTVAKLQVGGRTFESLAMDLGIKGF